MGYRWDPQPLPPQLNPQIVEWVGKYATKVLALRGIDTLETAKAFVSVKDYTPTAATALPDMDRAVQRLIQAHHHQETVLIWGDFDCDGVTSTSLLLSAFKAFDFKTQYTIPLRSEEGHGLNSQRLQQVVDQIQPHLMITVDCGVANHTEIEQAQGYGIDVIVTDHHLLPDPLPQATAVINPLRLPLDHPLRYLPGVGVAYKLAEALYAALEWPGVEQFLDLAVVGIVADVAVLQRECRYLVQKGLPILSHSNHQGLKQLIQHQVGDREVSATDVGFRIAPKLNAIGRLDDATLAVELLTTPDPDRAAELIDRFILTNETRKALTEEVVNEASQQIEGLDLQTNRAIVLASPDWSQGVVGIAASRLVETYGCPTVLIACRTDKGEGYGSGRSIPSVNLVEALDEVAPLLEGYGGHPMAAGLRVSLGSLAAVQAGLTRALSERVSLDQLERDLRIDLMVDLNLIKDPVAVLDEIYQQLMALEPFGHGNPKPILALLNFKPRRFNPEVSKSGEHLYFKVGRRRLWYWRAGDQLRQLEQTPALDIAFTLEPASFGDQLWQGTVKDVKPSGDWDLQRAPSVALRVQDYRRSDHLPVVASVYDGTIPAPDRELLILRWPDLPDNLKLLLQKVQPHTIYLAAKPTDFSSMQEAIVQFVSQWDSGVRDPQHLAQSGITESLIQQALRSASSEEAVVQQVVEILQESQAFHQWLDQAAETDIAKLCKRLIV